MFVYKLDEERKSLFGKTQYGIGGWTEIPKIQQNTLDTTIGAN
jgi:hypothetical protein